MRRCHRLHRETGTALIPRSTALMLNHAAITTEPSEHAGRDPVVAALEQLPTTLVDEIRTAVAGRLPDIRLPLSGMLFGQEGLSLSLGGVGDPAPGPHASVVESVRYVYDVAPLRAKILHRIVEELMPQFLLDAHGRSDEDRCTRRLAAVLIVASVVTMGIAPSGLSRDQAAIGLGLGAAVLVARVMTSVTTRIMSLSESPSPAPRGHHVPPRMVTVPVTQNQIVLCDFGTPEPGALPDAAFASNGLVTPVAGGLVIRTGAVRASALVTLSIEHAEPQTPHLKWQEVVDVSFAAATDMSLVGSRAVLSLPDHGDYRARVQARRRDVGVEEGDVAGEEYEIVVWAAPSAAQRILRTTDQLGHRLRGESEPAPLERPEVAFRSVVGLFPGGATLTVTVGSTLKEVLRSFGADPVAQRSHDLHDGLLRPVEIPSRTALQPGILIIEPTSFEGSEKSVLEELSRRGRATSIF